PTCRELRFHYITGASQLGDNAIDVVFLMFEPLDTLAEFCERDLELGDPTVAQIVEIEHLAHFLEREADRLAGEHIGQPRAVAAGVEPLLAAPRGVEQALLLIEPQRARRDAEFLGEIADGENVTLRRSGVEAGNQIRNPAIGAFQLGHVSSRALLSRMPKHTSSLRKRKVLAQNFSMARTRSNSPAALQAPPILFGFAGFRAANQPAR